MPGTAFLGGTEGCAQSLSHQREASDVKRSSSGKCSGARAEKAKEALGAFPGM